jgi:hypothetical protein
LHQALMSTGDDYFAKGLEVIKLSDLLGRPRLIGVFRLSHCFNKLLVWGRRVLECGDGQPSKRVCRVCFCRFEKGLSIRESPFAVYGS